MAPRRLNDGPAFGIDHRLDGRIKHRVDELSARARSVVVSDGKPMARQVSFSDPHDGMRDWRKDKSKDVIFELATYFRCT